MAATGPHPTTAKQLNQRFAACVTTGILDLSNIDFETKLSNRQHMDLFYDFIKEHADKIKSLNFSNCRFNHDDVIVACTFLRECRNLKILNLHNVYDDSYDDGWNFWILTGAFPNIREFHPPRTSFTTYNKFATLAESTIYTGSCPLSIDRAYDEDDKALPEPNIFTQNREFNECYDFYTTVLQQANAEVSALARAQHPRLSKQGKAPVSAIASNQHLLQSIFSYTAFGSDDGNINQLFSAIARADVDAVKKLIPQLESGRLPFVDQNYPKVTFDIFLTMHVKRCELQAMPKLLNIAHLLYDSSIKNERCSAVTRDRLLELIHYIGLPAQTPPQASETSP